MNATTKSERAAVEKAAPSAKPAIAAWLKEILNKGERYAGVVLGKDGMPNHHLVLMAGSVSDITWGKAKEWAAKLGGELPTRQEQSLLFANLKAEFEPRYYWSSEQHAGSSGCAWGQGFSHGCQDGYHKSNQWRARAVRRLVIL